MNPVIGDLFLIVGSAAGAYFGAYWKKKGEDRAVKDGFAELLRQARETTAATKAIEAKISHEVWDRQKRWELKRDVLFEAMRRWAEIDDALLSFHTVFDVERKNPTDNLAQSKSERVARWIKAAAAFDETRMLVSIVCARETRSLVDDVGKLTNQLASKISEDPDIFSVEVRADLYKRVGALKIAIRKELGADNPSPGILPAGNPL